MQALPKTFFPRSIDIFQQIRQGGYGRPPIPHFHMCLHGGGTITTTFDMTVLNHLDRFHLVVDVIDRVPSLRNRGPI